MISERYLGKEDAVLKAAEEGAGENEAPGPPEKSESNFNVNFEQV